MSADPVQDCANENAAQAVGRPAALSSVISSLSADLWPTTPLARAIVLVLAVKLAAVVSMQVLLFSGDQRPVVDEMVMSRVLGPSSSP